MSTIIRIRRAELSDVERIAEIHCECWREVYAFMPDEVHAARGIGYRLTQWEEWFGSPKPNHLLIVILSEEKVVGFAVAKPNSDTDIQAYGEFHACYILPDYRGGTAGPLAMAALATYLHDRKLFPACIWAFRSNPYRRIYPALGCIPKVFRNRLIAGVSLPEIGYLVPDYQPLLNRLEKMRASAAVRQSQLPQRPRRLSRLFG